MRTRAVARWWSAGALACALGATAACGGERPQMGEVPSASGPPSQIVRTGGFAAGPPRMSPSLAGTLDESPAAVAAGRRAYTWMNCAGCHGARGGGGMGPPLADAEWIYGAAPENIYQTIVQGRPGGMPAYDQLPPTEVWRIVAYVRSLGPVPEETGASTARADVGAREMPLTEEPEPRPEAATTFDTLPTTPRGEGAKEGQGQTRGRATQPAPPE